MKEAIFTIFPFLVLFAAMTDTFSMRISNRNTLLLVAFFFPMAFMIGLPVETIGMHIVAGALVLFVGLVLFSFGWVGGGDVKLIAAISLWLGWDLVLEYTLLAALLGGLVTFGIIILRKSFSDVPQLITSPIAKILDENNGVPYGIALSAAGLIIYQQSFWFDQLIITAA